MKRRRSRWLAGIAALVLCAGVCATAGAADPSKVLHIAFPAAETGFDPVRASDSYSSVIIEAVFEPLYTYDYLARPAKVVPKTADGMPEVSDGGRTYLIHLQRGIYFTPDPAFGGKPRELTAEDYVYSFKRFADPANRSPWAFLVLDRFVGLDDAVEAAKKSGKFDYDATVPGIVALDNYTLRFKLKRPDYLLLYTLAHSAFGAVAHEVVAKYGNDLEAHPVGTGPYLLKEWRRAAKIVLEANPDFRKMVWDFQPTDDPWDRQVVADMKGKTIPQIGRVEISDIEESQSRWLAFRRKELDLLALPPTFRAEALDDSNHLKPAFADEGVKIYRAIDPSVTYSFFNFRDPLVGGFSKEKIALRRAVIMGYNLPEEIRVVEKGQSVQAQMLIPVWRRRIRPELPQHQPVRPGSRQRAPRLLRVQERHRRLPDAARRPAAHAAHGDRHRSDRPRA